MNAFAVCHLRNVTMDQPIATYLERIDATLAPYHGRFLIHGDPPEILEGAFDSVMVMLQFPDTEAARAWYRSDAYQAILPLRTGNAECDTFLIQGVAADHKATDVLAQAMSFPVSEPPNM